MIEKPGLRRPRAIAGIRKRSAAERGKARRDFLFNIDFVVNKFGVMDLGHYISAMKEAGSNDLRELRAAIKQHRKLNSEHQAFADVPDFSTHDAIISAINNELRNRSVLRQIERLTFPLRRLSLRVRRGLLLKKNDAFGALKTLPNKRALPWFHWPLSRVMAALARFYVDNWRFIIGAIIVPIVIAIFAYLYGIR